MLFCIFLPSLHDYDMKVAYCGGRKANAATFFFFLNFDRVFRQTERDGISAIKFEAARTETLLRDDFVAVAFTLRFPLENVS